MAGKDIIKMSIKELKRLQVVQEVIGNRGITQRTAALILGLSERQLRRLVRGIRKEGDRGTIHKARGRPSNRRISEEVKVKVLQLYEKKYLGLGLLWPLRSFWNLRASR